MNYPKPINMYLLLFIMCSSLLLIQIFNSPVYCMAPGGLGSTIQSPLGANGISALNEDTRRWIYNTIPFFKMPLEGFSFLSSYVQQHIVQYRCKVSRIEFHLYLSSLPPPSSPSQKHDAAVSFVLFVVLLLILADERASLHSRRWRTSSPRRYSRQMLSQTIPKSFAGDRLPASVPHVRVTAFLRRRTGSESPF